MSDVPKTIRCRVLKKSRWMCPGNLSGQSKSITFDIVPGRYFAVGDENNLDSMGLLSGTFSLSASAAVPCFFDAFEVGQLVEIEIKSTVPDKQEE